MDIFSYVITHDYGFAPNPFGGFLTLATCKPKIRLSAAKGDFIVGSGSAATVGNQKLVYAAKVDQVISIADYGRLPEYEIKRPAGGKPWWRKHGDNIYVRVGGKWTQRRNPHHGAENIARDLGGKNVLICKQFWYFGDAAIPIPDEFAEIVKKGPGHKRISDPALVRRFVAWLMTLPRGVHGSPETRPPATGCGSEPRTRC